jgi:hypothetical protein
MSRIVIVILIYHRLEPIDHIRTDLYSLSPFVYFLKNHLMKANAKPKHAVKR